MHVLICLVDKLQLDLFTLSLHKCRIDCAGILKLRNSDIELRKGETDIGRKNTRVRMVFRVHINQATGRTVSLQAASNPIECCEYIFGFPFVVVNNQLTDYQKWDLDPSTGLEDSF